MFYIYTIVGPAGVRCKAAELEHVAASMGGSLVATEDGHDRFDPTAGRSEFRVVCPDPDRDVPAPFRILYIDY